jgi:hypothetical protein
MGAVSKLSETGPSAFHLGEIGLIFGRAIMGSWQRDTYPSRGVNCQDHVNFSVQCGT